MSITELFPTRPAKFIEATATTRRHMAHYEVVAVFHDRTRELVWSGPWRDECNRQIRRAMDRFHTNETRIIRDGGEQ
jgi:hypothetical protein